MSSAKDLYIALSLHAAAALWARAVTKLSKTGLKQLAWTKDHIIWVNLGRLGPSRQAWEWQVLEWCGERGEEYISVIVFITHAT